MNLTRLSPNVKSQIQSPNFQSQNFQSPNLQSPDFQCHKIHRSATISVTNPEMSSFVHNQRRLSQGNMNNIITSKKDIRMRAKAVKKQEEKERKRREREHLKSASELSKSCIENLLTDEM